MVTAGLSKETGEDVNVSHTSAATNENNLNTATTIDQNKSNVNDTNDVFLDNFLTHLHNTRRALDKTLTKNSLDHTIILLGNTQDGKSTLTKLLSGNVENLTVVGSNPYPYIKDTTGEVGGGTGESCTIAPKIFHIGDSGITGVDNPGWNDNRGALYELLNMQLIKYVISKVQQVKFLIVVQYSSCLRDTNKEPRLKSLENAMQIIEVIPESLNCVGLVVTKVDSKQTPENTLKVVTDVLKEDVTALKKDNGKPQLVTLIEQLISQKNIFLLPRPLKPDDITEEIPLKRILVNRPNEEKMPYYQAICCDLLEFCTRLEYAMKSDNLDFVVSPSDAAKYQLTERVFPILLERIQISFQLLVGEALNEIEKNVKNNNQDFNTYLKLMEAEVNLKMCQSPTQEWNVIQLFTDISNMFGVNFNSGNLDKLTNAENYFRELHQMTQISSVKDKRFSATVNGINELVNKVGQMKDTFDVTQQQKNLQKFIPEEVHRQLANLKSAYLKRHESLASSEGLRGLAFKNLADHLRAVLDLSPTEMSNPGTGFELLYQVLGLPLARKTEKEGIKSLSLSHLSIAKLGKTSLHDPQQLRIEISKLLANLKKDVGEQWITDIEQQMKSDMKIFLDQLQQQCVSKCDDESEIYHNVEDAIKILEVHKLQLERYLVELEEITDTTEQVELPLMVQPFRKIFGEEHCITKIACVLEDPKFERVFTNTKIYLRDEVTTLLKNTDNLLARYRYINEVRKFCQTHQHSRQFKADITDKHKLLTSVKELAGFPKLPSGTESGIVDKLILKEFNHKAFDSYSLVEDKTSIMFGAGNVSIKKQDLDDLSSPHQPSQVKLYLLAGETVLWESSFISQDVNTLFVGAENVEWGDTEKIVLQGKTGEEKPRAPKGLTWGSNGENGGSGSRGGRGGDIYLVTENGFSCKKLELCSVGGAGGPGQNGGHGYDGEPNSTSIAALIKNLNTQFVKFDGDFKSICTHFQFTSPNLADLQISKDQDLPATATSYKLVLEKVQRRWSLLAVLETTLNFILRNLDDKDVISKHCFCQTFENVTSPLQNTKVEVESLLKTSLGHNACSSTARDCKVVSQVRQKSDAWKQIVLKNTKIPSKYKDGDTDGMVQGRIIAHQSYTASRKIKEIHKYLTDFPAPSESNQTKSTDSGTTYSNANQPRGIGGTGGDGGVGGCPGSIVVHHKVEHSEGITVVQKHGPTGKKGAVGYGTPPTKIPPGEINRTTSDARCPKCPQNPQYWEASVIEPLLQCLNSTEDPNKMYRLFSTLVVHDWALERVLTPETFLTAYQNLLIDVCSKGPLSHDRLEVEQDFQRHLTKFQNVRQLDSTEQQVVTSLLENSQMMTSNVRQFLQKPKLILNFEKHLESSLHTLEALHTSKRVDQWTDNYLAYQQLWKNKIRQTTVSLGKDVSDVVEEIREVFQTLQKDVQRELEKSRDLVESTAKYERAGNLVTLFKYVLSGLSQVLYMTLPGSQAVIGEFVKPVNSGASLLNSLIEGLNPDYKTPKAFIPQELNDWKALVQAVENSIKEQRDKIEKIKTELGLTSLQQHANKLTKLLEDLSGVKKYDKKHLERVDSEIDDTREAVIKILEETKPASSSVADPEKIFQVNKVKLELRTADWKNVLYNTKKDGALPKILEFFRKKKAKDDANMRVVSAKKCFGPTLENLVDLVESHLQQKGPGGSSEAYAWKIKDILAPATKYLIGFVEGLPSEKKLQKSFEKIESAVEMHMTAWASIRKYEEKKEKANFIAKVGSDNLDYSGGDVGDAFKNKQTKIEFLVCANLLLIELIRTQDAFEQWCFPYADKYMQDHVEVINEVKALCSGISKRMDPGKIWRTVVQTAGKAAKIVEHFENEFKKSQSQLEAQDNVLSRAKFSQGQPFYTWKSNEFKDLIWKLFSGVPINFVADIKNSPVKKGAVKVNGDVDLRFVYRNGAVEDQMEYQEALNLLLKKLRLEMTFQGDSLYRVEKDMYIIYGTQVSLTGSIETGEKVGRSSSEENNKTREKMKDFVMSPYGKWTFRLMPVNPEDSSNIFGELANMFGHCVDIHLVGNGQFLDENASSWQDNMPHDVGKYYKKYTEQ